MTSAHAPRNLKDKLVTAIRSDPKKAGILTVLVAILAVLQMRLHTGEGDGASSAIAATATPGGIADTAGATSTASNSRSGDGLAALKAWMNAPAAPLGRNLFALDLERFPSVDGKALSSNSTPTSFWDVLEKSMSSKADVRKERQILIENLARQASQLRLQSTVMGASPKAVIDGGMVGEGDVVASGSGESRVTFRVLKIEPRRIIVEREGIKLEIQMK